MSVIKQFRFQLSDAEVRTKAAAILPRQVKAQLRPCGA